MRYQGALEPLKRLLHDDPEWIVRASAAEALGNYTNPSLLSDLEQAVEEDEEPSVRGYAVSSLGVLAPPSYVPKLEAYLATEQDWPEFTGQLLAALYRLGASGSLQRLLEVINAADDLEEAFFLLNLVEDLTERKVPKALRADAPRLREALTAVGRRVPLEQPHVDEILETLSRLEQTQFQDSSDC
jgi:HEAT repeat protein